MYIFEQTIAL